MPRKTWLKRLKPKIHSKNKEKTEIDPKIGIGPINIAQMGRYIKFSSSSNSNSISKIKKSLLSSREELKDEINQKIQETLSLISKYDSLKLLCSIALESISFDPETYIESITPQKEPNLEYSLSLALGVENKSTESPPREAGVKFRKNISDILRLVMTYFTTENITKESLDFDSDIRFLSVMGYLGVRGDSYIQHHLDLFNSLFTPHDSFLLEKFGFVTSDIISLIAEIKNQIQTEIEHFKKFTLHRTEFDQLLNDFLVSRNIDYESKFNPEIAKEFESIPHVSTLLKESKRIKSELKENIFEIKLNPRINTNLLQKLASTFEENVGFLEFEKSPGWPLNTSIIHSKPIIKHNGKYYSFGIVILSRNLIRILEDLIKHEKKDYYLNSFKKISAKFLEKRSLDYLESILPNAEIYLNVHYKIIENGIEKDCESDGLIVFDTNLFIIEAKAITYPISARRGSSISIKKTLQKNIDKAYSQALRTKKYIKNSNSSKFTYENGSNALVIDQNKIKEYFLLNITLENLGFLTTQLQSVKNYNLIQGIEWPWTVFINDLRIISEVIESPSIFLLYLKRRIEANEYEIFKVFDEIDYFTFFLNEGLYLEDNSYESYKSVSPLGYTDQLDRYYAYKQGMVSSGEKPILQASIAFKRIITKIEATKKYGFTSVTTTLLGLHSKFQEKILFFIDMRRKESGKDGKDKWFFIPFDNTDEALIFAIRTNPFLKGWEDTFSYVQLRMYTHKVSTGFLILITYSDNTNEEVDFEIFKKKWKFNPDMEERKDNTMFRTRRISTKRKIGRNESCSCGSGLKYKSCCGRNKN